MANAKPKRNTPPSSAAPARTPEENAGIFDNFRIGALLVFLLAAVVYLNTIPNFYVQDDVPAITGNKYVQQGIEGIPTLLKTGFVYGLLGINEGTYRPVSLVSFAIEHSLWGNNPHLSHAVNLLLYAISVLLLYYLLWQLLGKRYALFSFLACAIYAVHPIHTEAVANIKSRDEIFCFFFAILSMICFIRMADMMQKKEENSNSKPYLWAFIGVICFFLSILSKETSLPFLVIIPLTIYYFRGLKGNAITISAVVSAVGAGAYLLLRMVLFSDVVNIHGQIQKTDNIMAHAKFMDQKATAIAIIGKYLGLLVFPKSLSYDYSFHQIPLYSFADWQAYLSFFITAGAFVYALMQMKKRTIPSYGILFFFISMAVIANIFLLIGSAMGERFMYIPSFGFTMVLAYLLVHYVFKAGRQNALNAASSVPGWIVAGLLIVLYGGKTIARNFDWKDNFTLYKVDVKHAPNSARTHYSLGTELSVRAQESKNKDEQRMLYEQSEDELKTALKINPEYPDAIINLANVYHNLGEFDKEMELLGKVQTDNRGQGEVMYNAGNALMEKGDIAGAIRSYKLAIANRPDFADPYVNLGSVYSSIGQVDSSIYFLKKAIELNPKIVQAYINIGSAYSSKGQVERAIGYYRQAIAIDPKSAEVYVNLGSAFINTKNLAGAIENLNKAISLNPNIPEAYYNLGYAYQLQNHYEQAITSYKAATNLRPTYKDAFLNMGYCALSLNHYQESLDYYDKVMELDPNGPNAYLSAAYVYKKMGNNAKALEYKQKGDALQRK